MKLVVAYEADVVDGRANDAEAEVGTGDTVMVKDGGDCIDNIVIGGHTAVGCNGFGDVLGVAIEFNPSARMGDVWLGEVLGLEFEVLKVGFASLVEVGHDGVVGGL